jgi:predicted secreted protein
MSADHPDEELDSIIRAHLHSISRGEDQKAHGPGTGNLLAPIFRQENSALIPSLLDSLRMQQQQQQQSAQSILSNLQSAVLLLQQQQHQQQSLGQQQVDPLPHQREHPQQQHVASAQQQQTLQQTFSTVIELVKAGTINPSSGARMIAQMVNNIPGAGADKIAGLASASVQQLVPPGMPQASSGPRMSDGVGGGQTLSNKHVAALQHALQQSAGLSATPELQQLLLNSGILDKLALAGDATRPQAQQPMNRLGQSPRTLASSPRTLPVSALSGQDAQVDLDAAKQLWQVCVVRQILRGCSLLYSWFCIMVA